MKRTCACLFAAVLLLAVVPGCAPSRPYSQGVLATDVSSLSGSDLSKHAEEIRTEAARVERGSPPPEGVSREQYLADLNAALRRTERRMGIQKLEDQPLPPAPVFGQPRATPLP